MRMVGGSMAGEIFQMGHGNLVLRAAQSMHSYGTTCCKESIAPPLVIIFTLEGLSWNSLKRGSLIYA